MPRKTIALLMLAPRRCRMTKQLFCARRRSSTWDWNLIGFGFVVWLRAIMASIAPWRCRTTFRCGP